MYRSQKERRSLVGLVYAADNGADVINLSVGSSAAAPHVAGVAALVIGAHGGAMAPDAGEAVLRASRRRPRQTRPRRLLRARPRQRSPSGRPVVNVRAEEEER